MELKFCAPQSHGSRPASLPQLASEGPNPHITPEPRSAASIPTGCRFKPNTLAPALLEPPRLLPLRAFSGIQSAWCILAQCFGASTRLQVQELPTTPRLIAGLHGFQTQLPSMLRRRLQVGIRAWIGIRGRPPPAVEALSLRVQSAQM